LKTFFYEKILTALQNKIEESAGMTEREITELFLEEK
jgi:hypothetical protein